MLKRVLFLIGNEQEAGPINDIAKSFKNKFNVSMDALYVKDMIKYEVFPSTVEGIGLNIGANYAFQEFRELEEITFKKLKDKVKQTFNEVYDVEGETVEATLEFLKPYDVLIILKNEKPGPYLRELLRTHYKPMIVFSEKEEYKFDKVLLLDDGGYKANRSLFEFFNIFGEQKADVLRVNVDDKDLTGERFKENYNLISKEGDPLKVIIEEVENYDFIIMGDLKYAAMLEKITGKLGIRLLEAIKKPIFIG